MAYKWDNKDPDELDYRTHDWSGEGGTISGTPTATITSGDIVKESTSTSGMIQTVWLSGGTDGTLNTITLQAEFTDGRILQEVVEIWTREKR